MSRLALSLAILLAAPAVGRADPAPDQVHRAVAEASAVMGLPQDLLLRVMAAESGGRARAVSPAGALGLMQLMPPTWAELRSRLGLGPDPFDVRDNVLAGAVYLRDMLDRFGVPGFLAAYNLGPARYARRIASGRGIPPETLVYMARVARGGHAPASAIHAGTYAGPAAAALGGAARGLVPSDAGLFVTGVAP
jgi:soluble lytic murein transglycosylase-like protein